MKTITKQRKPLTRRHRNNFASAERPKDRLWNELLRNRQIRGYSFLRQQAIDEYIADFFCKELKLIIEVDGHSQNHKYEADTQRDARLVNPGYRTLRFTDEEVMRDINNVRRVIELWIEHHPPSPFIQT